MLIVVCVALGIIFGYLAIGLTIPMLIAAGLSETTTIPFGIAIGLIIVAISVAVGWIGHKKDSSPR